MFIPPRRRLQIVAAGGGIADEVLNQGGTQLRFNFRIPFIAGGDIDEFWPSFDGWFINAGTNAETNIPTAISLSSLAFEIDGVVVPSRFGGGRTKTVNPGAERQFGDGLKAADFGLNRIRGDKIIWSRGYGTLPSSSARIPLSAYCGASGAKFSVFASGTDNTDATGALPAQSGETTNTYGFGPTCLIGRLGGRARPAVIGFGSSSTAGTGDTTPTMIGGGLLNRALLNSDGKGAIGGFACGVNGGATLDEFISNNAKRREYFRYATHFLDQHHNAGTTPISGEVEKSRVVWEIARQRGCKRIIRVAYQPDTESTDGWATTANQSINASGSWSVDFYEAMADLVASGELQGLVSWNDLRADTNPANENWQKWRPGGSAASIDTADGLHATSHGYRLPSGEARRKILDDWRLWTGLAA